MWDGKQFVPRLVLPLSLSYDHRVIDGASAARFNAYLGQVLADYRSYVDCQDRVDELYQNPEEWAYKAMLNIANMGYFSSDRTIQEYAKYIWHIDPVRL